MKKKPYVIYKLSADVNDRGIGFTLREAIVNYMRSHKVEYQIRVLANTSDKFDANLEIYDNGGEYFSIQSLLESIGQSKRLPINEKARPKINVIPLPRDNAVEKVQENSTPWEKVVDGLTEESEGYKKQIKRLTEDVVTQQEVISRQANRISELEKKAVSCADPTELLLQHYFPSCLENLLECAVDWDSLSPMEKEMLKEKMADITYLDYVNRRQKENGKEQFKNEVQIHEWMKLTSPEGKEEHARKYEEVKEQFESAKKDYSALSSIESAEKSPELAKSLTQMMQTISNKINCLGEQMNDLEKSMKDREETYDALCKYREDYDRLAKLLERAKKRRKNPAIFPVIFTQGHQDMVYMPSVSPDSDLEKYICNLLIGNLRSSNEAENKHYLKMTIKKGVVPTETLIKLEQSKILRVLGIRPQISLIGGKMQ